MKSLKEFPRVAMHFLGIVGSEARRPLTLIAPVLIILCFVMFRHSVFAIIDSILVKPIFSKIGSDMLTSLSFAFSQFFIVFYVWRQRDHRYITAACLYALFFFLLVRIDDYWNYTSIYQIGSWRVFYIDSMAICWIILLLRHGIQAIRKKKTIKTACNTEGFMEDLVVENLQDDSYERTQIAKKIAELIMQTPGKRAFAIGITGCYGSGKTSFLSLLWRAFEKPHNQPLLISFNPWDASSATDIQKMFFDELTRHLSKESRALSSSMYNYYRRLNHSSNKITDIVNNIRALSLLMSYDVDDERGKIDKMMGDLGKKIIIVIDDLDRLHNEEVMEILKIIRNTANFKNITYVVAYDKNYVEQAIKSINKTAYNNYLEKIFQLEIPLPKAEPILIAESLIRSLEIFLAPEEMHYMEGVFLAMNFEPASDESIGGIFKTQRDIVRFANNFKLSYSLIAKEVDFVQLLHVEILKYAFPIAYDLLYEQRYEVLTLTRTQVPHYGLSVAKDKVQYEYLLVELFNKQFPQHNIKLLRRLLKILFDYELTLDSNDKTRTIGSASFFDLYFTGRVATTALSEYDFRQNMLHDEALIPDYLNQQLLEGKHKAVYERVMRMELKEYKTKNIYEAITSAFVKTVIPKVMNANSAVRIDYERYIFLHFDLSTHILDLYYEGDIVQYREHIMHIFKQTTTTYLFLSELARRLLLKYGSKHFLSIDELYDIQLNALKAGLKQDRKSISREVSWMFFGIRYHFAIGNRQNHYDPADEESWRIHESAVKLIHKVIQKRDIQQLLELLITKDMYSDNRYQLSQKLIKDVFSDIERLKLIVKANKKISANFKNEFLDFLEKCGQQKEYIRYSFTVISPG